MSSGKHEYMKHICYKDEVDQFAEYIKETSGKTAFTEAEMTSFIDDGRLENEKNRQGVKFWR